MPRRWDGDDRGHGVGDAVQLVSGASELVAAFSESAWVAEQPEIHLRPHVDAWCHRDQRLALIDAQIDDTHAYILELEWRGAPGSVGEARATVFSLIGSFAESATYVRQRGVRSRGDGSPMKLRFEVGTGELAPETRFAPHGHVVVLNVWGELEAEQSAR
jgi:hypothetical protein